MATVNYDNLIPRYRNTTVGSYLKLDAINNALEIYNGATGRIAINSS